MNEIPAWLELYLEDIQNRFVDFDYTDGRLWIFIDGVVRWSISKKYITRFGAGLNHRSWVVGENHEL